MEGTGLGSSHHSALLQGAARGSKFQRTAFLELFFPLIYLWLSHPSLRFANQMRFAPFPSVFASIPGFRASSPEPTCNLDCPATKIVPSFLLDPNMCWGNLGYSSQAREFCKRIWNNPPPSASPCPKNFLPNFFLSGVGAVANTRFCEAMFVFLAILRWPKLLLFSHWKSSSRCSFHHGATNLPFYSVAYFLAESYSVITGKNPSRRSGSLLCAQVPGWALELAFGNAVGLQCGYLLSSAGAKAPYFISFHPLGASVTWHGAFWGREPHDKALGLPLLPPIISFFKLQRSFWRLKVSF